MKILANGAVRPATSRALRLPVKGRPGLAHDRPDTATKGRAAMNEI